MKTGVGMFERVNGIVVLLLARVDGVVYTGFCKKEEVEVDFREREKATAKLNRQDLLLIINTRGLAVATANNCTKCTSAEGTESNPKAAEFLGGFVSAICSSSGGCSRLKCGGW